MLQYCFGEVDGINRSDKIGTSSWFRYADDIFLNLSMYVLSKIFHGGWSFMGDIHILLYLNY